MISNPHALIVATESYADSGLGALQSPSQDAEKLSEVLSNPAIGNYRLTTLLNKPGELIREEIEGFFAERKPADLALLYVSGHGIKDPNGDLYFAASTTKLQRLAATGISAQFVYQQVSRCRAGRIVLLLDCCFSGAYLKGHIPRAANNVQLPSPPGKGWAVITSSTALEYSFEADTWESSGKAVPSVFTAALVQGLRTGEADRDGDGFVSVEELYDYLVEEVRKATSSQTPEIKYGDIRGRIVIAKNPYAFHAESRAIAGDLNYSRAQQAYLREVRLTSEELERSYSDALSAYYAGRWQEAVEGLQQVVESDSTFKDAPGKLVHASRQLHLTELYSAAFLALEDGNWGAAVKTLEEVRRVDPGYKDSVKRSEIAQLGFKSADLVSKAESLFQSRSLAEVEAICAELAMLATRLARIADNLGANASSRVLDQEVNLRYRLALVYFEAHEWPRALAELNRVNRIRPGHRDSVHLIDHARAEIMKSKRSHEAEPIVVARAEGIIYGVSFSGDSQVLAVNSSRGTRIFEIATGRIIIGFRHDELHSIPALSPDGQLIAMFNTKIIELRKTKTGEICQSLRLKAGAMPTRLAFSRDNKHLVVLDGRSLTVWDVRSGFEVGKLATDVEHQAFALAANGRIFAYPAYLFVHVKRAINGKDKFGRTRISDSLDEPSIETLRAFATRKEVGGLALSPEGNYLAVVFRNGSVRAWDVPGGTVLPRLRFLKIPGFGMKSVEFSSDSKLLATTSVAGKAYIWEIASGVSILTIPNSDHFCFSPDMRLIATACGNEVRVHTSSMLTAATEPKNSQDNEIPE